MGSFARFVCLRRDGTVEALARDVLDMLKARQVSEATDPASAERLLLVAPAGDGWLMVMDHAENPSEAVLDHDGLLAELCRAAGMVTIDIVVADDDDLVLSLTDGTGAQFQLAIGNDGLKGGAPEAWESVLMPGYSTRDIRPAFAARTTFVGEHFPTLAALFGIDLSVLRTIDPVILAGDRPAPGAPVLLRLESASVPGQVIGLPRLVVDDGRSRGIILHREVPRIPCGVVTHIPPFAFQSRGRGARGLEVRLAGSALQLGLIEVISAKLLQHHPIDPDRDRNVDVVPENTAGGLVVRFEDLEVPDWIEGGPRPVRRSPRDLRVFVYCRALKAGDGELEAMAHLVSPASAPARASCPVTVLPDMWRPLRMSEQVDPREIDYIRQLNCPTRLNALAVLHGGTDSAIRALRQTLQTWQSLTNNVGRFEVCAATGPVEERHFFTLGRRNKTTSSFTLDAADTEHGTRGKQTKWSRLTEDLASVCDLSIVRDYDFQSGAGFDERIVLAYLSAATHPHLPQYAARMAHVSLSCPKNAKAERALVSLMRGLAAEGIVCQGHVAAWDERLDDNGLHKTLYERAVGVRGEQLVAEGWGTRYLRAVADRLWLGPMFAARLDRVTLDRVAIVEEVGGGTLAVERRPGSALRDLELCLEPVLASLTELRAFQERFG